MAKIAFKGLSEYIASLEKLGRDAGGITRKALYEGVDVTADEVRNAIEALPTDDRRGHHRRKGITSGQKKALLDGLGVAPFREDGDMINTLVGFSGYSDYATRKYPNGQPLALIARVAESWNSFTDKTPFMAPAVRKARKPAQEKMKEVFENEIDEIMKG